MTPNIALLLPFLLTFLLTPLCTHAQSRPRIGSVPYGQIIKSCTITPEPKSPHKIALTFDDGPFTYTALLLDKLKAAGVRATFFVVGDGKWVGRGTIDDGASGNPALLKRMVAEGHQVASHTWSHPDMSRVMPQARREQVTRLETAFIGILGMYPTYFRPPFSSCDDACLADMRDMGYHVVNFDLDTRDFKGDYPFSESLFASALRAAGPSTSFIALAHDVHQVTVERFADYMIKEIKGAGFEAVTVGECLGDPKENWYRGPDGGVVGGKNVLVSAQSTSSAKESLPSAQALSSTVDTTSVALATVGSGGQQARGSASAQAAEHTANANALPSRLKWTSMGVELVWGIVGALGSLILSV